MIFKSALKYKIFEWCLDTLFNRITQNFIKKPCRRRIPSIGEYFSKVEETDKCNPDKYNCIITAYYIPINGIYELVMDIPYNINEGDIHIEFEYEYELYDDEVLDDDGDTEGLDGCVSGPISGWVFIK